MTKLTATTRNSIFISLFLILIVLALLFLFPNTTNEQFLILRILISLCIGSLASVIMKGFIRVRQRGFIAGGGFAVFAIVYAVNPAQLTADTISFSIFLHEKNNPEGFLAIKGEIVVDFGNDRRSEKIDERGGVYFKGIPPVFKNKKVKVSLLADTYALASNEPMLISNSAAIYLEVKRKNLDIVKGIVMDEESDFVKDAIVRIDDIITKTDSMGRFTIKIPERYQERSKKITVSKNGYKNWVENIMPETGELIEVKLSRIND